MKIFKLRPNDTLHYLIDKETFEEVTLKQAPYYSGGSHFAVCPACDNPIQLIGLIPTHTNDKAPYGKHFRNGIPGLARYGQFEYDCCPLAARKTYDREQRRPSGGVLSNKILTILREHFDRVVYVLEKTTGISISDNMAEAMLNSYLEQSAHHYVGSSLINIPWMLAYFSNSQGMYKRRITNEKMQQSILKKVTVVQFDANNRLEKKPGQYVTLNVCFIHHQTDGEGGEYVDMVVSEGLSFDEGRIVYKERQVFDHDFLERLMRKEGNESKRRQNLIDIAHRLIP